MNSDGKKCKTKYCRNEAATGKNYCYKCRSRAYKKSQPIAYHFNALRNNARRRGKIFDLTLQQFKDFCREHGYEPGNGRNPESLSIDRIDASRGYEIGNIQILTLSENSAKGCLERNEIEDLPF